jgi:zinc/manganese transport system substrate-binding protein
MSKLRIAALAFLVACPAAPALAQPVKVVAAENFYGNVVHQIAGPNVAVTSIMSNPDEDPHLFEASPSTARDLAAARIVIANGADYDPWIDKLLAANKAAGRKEIVVADLIGRKSGDNPHLWYDPGTMPALAKALAAELAAADPAHEAQYAKGAATFTASLAPLGAKIAAMRKKYAGQPVAASEPVFGYMAAAIGLVVGDGSFQLAVMNDTEPSASDVARFEDELRNHKVKVMLHNSQASDPSVERLVKIAEEAKVPVVGVSETEPAGKTYQQWMLQQLDALDKALAEANS